MILFQNLVKAEQASEFQIEAHFWPKLSLYP